MMKKKTRCSGLTILLGMTIVTIQLLQSLLVRAEPELTGEEELVESVTVEDSEIEQSVLVIGSYLIHINGITDDVVEVAEESANKFNQHNRYYKSELAGGKWYDVTNASSLLDITTGGEAVEDTVIEQLQFTHKVSATGQVTDLRYGYTVSSFDVNSPYVLWDLEELESIEQQYQLLHDKEGKTQSDLVTLSLLQQFYEPSIRNEITNRYDAIISGLEKYKNELLQRGKPNGWVEEVIKVMKHTDALRRIEALQILSEKLENLLNGVSGQQENLTYEKIEDGETVTESIDEYYVNSDLVEAIGQSIEKVEKSILEYANSVIPEGESATSQARFRYSNDLMSRVNITQKSFPYDNLPWYFRWYTIWLQARSVLDDVTYDQQACDTATQKLVDISNISKGMIVDVNSESATLHRLSEDALTAYKGCLAEGVNEEYQNAIVEHATLTVLTQCLESQKTKTDAIRLEYEELLAAYFERMSNTSAQQLIERLLNEIPNLQSVIPADAVQKYHLETVDEHEVWLRKQLVAIIANSEDTTQMEQLQQELAELELERQKALDQNRLDEEKRLEKLMEAKRKEIDALQEKLRNIAASPNSSHAEKAKAIAGLGNGNLDTLLNETASDIADLIRNGDLNFIEGGDGATQSDLNTLKDKLSLYQELARMDSEAAEAAMKSIDNAIANTSTQNLEVQEILANAKKEIKETIAYGKSQDAANADASMLQAMIENIMGTQVEDFTSLQLGSAVWALSRFGQDYQNQSAKNLAIAYAAEMYQEQNIYCYMKVNQDIKEYVSLKAIGLVLDYRYVFDDAHSSVTLSKGRDYKTFVHKNKEYLFGDKQTGTLKAATILQETLYISAEDSQKIYGIGAGYINGSKYAITVTQKIENTAREIYRQMEEQLN